MGQSGAFVDLAGGLGGSRVWQYRGSGPNGSRGPSVEDVSVAKSEINSSHLELRFGPDVSGQGE
jgi:hypothetical protein